MITQKTTYYLGAGASFNALPLAAYLKEDLLKFLQIFNPSFGSSYGPRIKFSKNLYERYLKSMEGFEVYPSVDTYAKSLHVRQDRDKIETFSEFLSLYLIFKQFDNTHLLKNPNQYSENKFNIVFNGSKDARYLGFLSKLYDNNQFNENVNIISWNYDTQLELAMTQFFDLDYYSVCDRLNTYPHSHKTIYSGNRESPKIVKLNGAAGLWHDKDRSVFNQILQNKIEFEELLLLAEEGKNLLSTVAFAWEETEIQRNAVYAANQLMQQTETLVIIGYSFPDFNWHLDSKVFLNNKIKEVFIQVPESDFIHIGSKVKNLVSPNAKVEHKGFLTEFYLPIHNRNGRLQYGEPLSVLKN